MNPSSRNSFKLGSSMLEQTCSLVLAAHGSLAANNSNQPLFDLADAISKLDRFASVTPAFLNGRPEMTNVLEQLPPGNVVIVPVMTSEGYYLKKLPEKFQQNNNVDLFRCFMSRVIGVHESIPGRISNRIKSLLSQHELEISETTVVVIGHGTRRNQTSGQATHELTEKLGALHPGLKFETAFLDQDPEAAIVANQIQTRNTLVIPFLISRGPHSTDDVPAAFGLPGGPHVEFPISRKNQDGICICDSPVGMYPDMADVCIELASEALAGGSSFEVDFVVGGVSI